MVKNGKLTDEGREYAKARMDHGAYYFRFESTGDPKIDLILGAVCAAGKMYHNTSQWSDDDYDRGWTPIDMIQAAASEAAGKS